MNSLNSQQNYTKSNMAVVSSDDPDFCLITNFSVFKSVTLTIIKDFFFQVKTYGSISDIPSENLIQFKKRFDKTLNHFNYLINDLSTSIDDTTRKLNKCHDEEGPGSFIGELYLKKQQRIVSKIEYYDYVYDLTEYVQYFLHKKIN